MFHKILFYFCFVFSIFIAQLPAYGQQARKLSTLNGVQKNLLQQIADYGMVESKNTGWTGMYSEQYARADSLKRISSTSDIMLFATHHSPIVKVYAFQMILESKDLNQAFTVLQDNFQDTTAYRFKTGCFKGASLVGKSLYMGLKAAIEKQNYSCTSQQKVLLAKINGQLPSYSYVRRIVARQLKDDE